MPILSNCLLSVNVLSGRKINGCANGHLYDLKICQKQQKRWLSIVNLCLLNRKKEAKAVEQKSGFATFFNLHHFHRATDFYRGILVCWQIVIIEFWPWQEVDQFAIYTLSTLSLFFLLETFNLIILRLQSYCKLWSEYWSSTQHH